MLGARGQVLVNRSRLLGRTANFLTIRISDEVKAALTLKKPIVALESTIISHGMPYPRNLTVAKDCEQTIRDNGAVPATIAIIDGIPHVGLNEAELMKLAKNDGSIVKASTRDLGYVCANKLSAATTVASTMRLAHMAGISVFATGGIGGVHRGAESTMDVSADLIELSKTPVTVVCAGIKSILDIPKSLEVLETNGVPVIGYTTKQFPAFFTNDSGVPSPLTVFYSPNIIADMMVHNRLLQLPTGMVVGVPNPQPANAEKIQYAINFAVNSAKNEGVSGAAITPYVLAKVEHLTGGESLESNVALVLNNCHIAAQIAVEYAKLKLTTYGDDKYAPFFNAGSAYHVRPDPVRFIDSSKDAEAAPVPPPKLTPEQLIENISKHADRIKQETSSSSAPAADVPAPSAPETKKTVESTSTTTKSQPKQGIVVVGGAVVDIIGNISTHTVKNTSNPGKLRISCGGVGRNIAENVARLGINVTLGTAVANDISGLNILDEASKIGIDVSEVKVLPSTGAGAASASTAVYNAIHDNEGELCIGVADMTIFNEISTEYVNGLKDVISRSKLVVVDGNITVEAIRALTKLCRECNVSVFFEPTSDHKCLLPFQAGCVDQIDIMKPNISELVQMASYCLSNNLIISGKSSVARTVSVIVSNRIDHVAQEVDISDVRILANAVHSVMCGNTNKPPVAGKAVFGKHVLVSMGARGVLWVGPSKIMSTGSAAVNRSSGIVVDEQMARANCQLPAVPIPEGQKILHTNGAGDALCGGVIAEIVTRMNLFDIKQRGVAKDTKVAASPPLLPDMDCLIQGMKNAQRWLITKKD